MRITRPFVLLALAVLLAPRIEASRASVWESNPPATFTATKSEAAGLLAAFAPAAAADVEAEEPRNFDLGDVVLVDTADADAEHFDLGPLTLVDLSLLRGPPPSYPETRVGGFELLPPVRAGASPTLSLWGRQACGFSCREVTSDSRYDPWGLAVVQGADGGTRIKLDNGEREWTFTRKEAVADIGRFKKILELGGWSRKQAEEYARQLEREHAELKKRTLPPGQFGTALNAAEFVAREQLQEPCRVQNWEFGNAVCTDGVLYWPDPTGPKKAEKRGRFTEGLPNCGNPAAVALTVHCHPNQGRPDVDNEYGTDDNTTLLFQKKPMFLLGTDDTLWLKMPPVVGEEATPKKITKIPPFPRFMPYCPEAEN